MPKKLDKTIMGGDFRRARAYVDRAHGARFVEGKDGYWYGPLVDAFVKGAQAARRAERAAPQVSEKP